MPTPKKKTSRMRRGHRRSHDGLQATTVNSCANCGAMKLPHHVCMSCGYYAGREVLAAQS